MRPWAGGRGREDGASHPEKQSLLAREQELCVAASVGVFGEPHVDM